MFWWIWCIQGYAGGPVEHMLKSFPKHTQKWMPKAFSFYHKGTTTQLLKHLLIAWSPAWLFVWRFGVFWEEQMGRKVYFVILAPLCSKTITFEGLGVHVGAHWGPKSYPNEARAAPNGRPERPRPPKSSRAVRLGWQGHGNHRKSSAPHITSEAKAA